MNTIMIFYFNNLKTLSHLESIQALADLDLIFVSHVVNSDPKQILTLANSDLNPIRTLANSDPISKTSLANSDLNFAGSELTSGRGPN